MRTRPGPGTIFGAQAHRFQLGPPLSGDEVTEFERRNAITLPADYRAFLTQVGNGGPGRGDGAGPFYGLFALADWATALVADDSHDGMLATPFPVVPDRTYGDDWLSEVGLGEDDECHQGAIALGHQGCGYISVLVVTGPGRGRIAYTSWGAMVPTYTADPDFLAWYERWLDAALRGDAAWW